jgi:hypothetical protein
LAIGPREGLAGNRQDYLKGLKEINKIADLLQAM